MTITPFERWSLWLTTAGTLLTGVVYWWMKDLMVSSDPWSVINHPLQPWMLKAHILIAPLMVFSVGLITSRHIWRHYRMGVTRGRKSGLIAALSFIVLVFSGYILQVLTGEAVVRVLGWAHLGLGIVYSLGLGAHWPATRGRPSAGEAGEGAPTTTSRPAAPDRRRRAGPRPMARRAAGD